MMNKNKWNFCLLLLLFQSPSSKLKVSGGSPVGNGAQELFLTNLEDINHLFISNDKRGSWCSWRSQVYVHDFFFFLLVVFDDNDFVACFKSSGFLSSSSKPRVIGLAKDSGRVVGVRHCFSKLKTKKYTKCTARKHATWHDFVGALFSLRIFLSNQSNNDTCTTSIGRIFLSGFFFPTNQTTPRQLFLRVYTSLHERPLAF